MAPTINIETLFKRAYCYDSYGYYTNCSYSSWNSWGRWVALAAIVLFVVFIALCFSCITSRRRRKRGLTPYYGTGWAANHKYGQTGGDGYGQQQAYNPPAPPYSPPAQHPQYTGQTFNSNGGYYGQQSGIELQQPQSAYTGPKGGDPVYAPPPGPPPSKRTGGY